LTHRENPGCKLYSFRRNVCRYTSALYERRVLLRNAPHLAGVYLLLCRITIGQPCIVNQ
jgi:hypothetical protein